MSKSTIDSTDHIRPIVLWQFICGGIDLPVRDYQHILKCLACESFGEQICEALGRIETAFAGPRPSSSRTHN
jgi:hypothetical protein